MSKQSMRTQLTIGVAALAFGAAFAVAPASAQQTPTSHYGRNLNDGGSYNDEGGQQTSGRRLYNSASPQNPKTPRKSETPYYSRNANDGGMVREPGSQQMAGIKPTTQKAGLTRYGRNLNDGGVQ